MLSQDWQCVFFSPSRILVDNSKNAKSMLVDMEKKKSNVHHKNGEKQSESLKAR